jgi:hypothetical protein
MSRTVEMNSNRIYNLSYPRGLSRDVRKDHIDESHRERSQRFLNPNYLYTQ